MPPPVRKYRGPARLLHWVIAVLLFLMIPAGFVMIQEGLAREISNRLFIFHKNMGVILLVLILLRVLFRLVNPPPPMTAQLPLWQERIAAASHGLLYLLLVVMPVAGYVRVRAGGFPIEMLDAWGVPALVPESEALANTAKAVHYYGALAITALIALHVGAALFHLIVRRDGVFQRMWPPVGGTR